MMIGTPIFFSNIPKYCYNKIYKRKQAIEKVISLIKDGKNNKIYEEYKIKILEPLMKKKLTNI